jgi:putative dimethyl sulfoxide reductase chaperone
MESHWNNLLTGEMLICGLLGRAWYVYPERAWVQSLIDDDVFVEAPFADQQPHVIAGLELLRAWSEQNRGGMSDQAFDDLLADYTRLFIGPDQVLAAPWESVFFNEERMTFQIETLQVREWYRRFGLEAKNLHNEPDDHIGLELEFMAHLAKSGLAALQQNDAPEFEKLLDAQRNFMSEHILRWGLAFCKLVETQTRTDFYRGVAMVTRGVLQEAAQTFDGKV